MNGQPTAENTRECGADGDMPGFRNWENNAHMDELARIWNVERTKLPAYVPPTHAMQIFRYAEEGTIRFLWISGTNPAISLPELNRIRRILNMSSLFVVVQDAFHTETIEYADVVLPAALWGEKTGCYTNVDRTVHLSEKAIEPPGQAKSDFDIFLDYARRMDFSDRDGGPLVKWTTTEECFEAWKVCSRGRPCDYSGMSYRKLRGSAGVQWPCHEQAPNGTPRLYSDHRFNTQAEYCETYGHDLATGAVNTQEEYQARDPQGKAFLRAAEYQPPHEEPNGEYPYWLTTGRLVYHWHTRTKTARSRELNQAAPDAFVQMHEDDAADLGVADGDFVEIESRRGRITVRAQLGDILQGHLFIPFHYGYWDDSSRARAANELTMTEWDPVSKQPHFKHAAVRAKKVSRPPTAFSQVGDALAGQVKTVARELSDIPGKLVKAVSTAGDQRPLSVFLDMTFQSQQQLGEAFKQVAQQHMAEPDVFATCMLMASWSAEDAEQLKPFISAYHNDRSPNPEGSVKKLFEGPRSGGLGLLRDLHDLWLTASEVHLGYEAVKQAARAIHDQPLVDMCERCLTRADRQIAWLRTRIDQAAPQTLIVS